MFYKVKSLKDYKLESLDGEIGKVIEFYFDDRFWIIRYLVAETGTWYDEKKVLISPYAMVGVIEDKQLISTILSKKQILTSPSWDSDKPVSRQYEETYFGYYGWPMYWEGPYMWGAYPDLIRDKNKWDEKKKNKSNWNSHLRSTNGVNGHYIKALDGEIGHVVDFIIDDDTWAIRYLVVDTQNWLPGKKVLIAPKWIERVSWSETKVYINLTREMIKNSPEFLEKTLLTRNYEANLYKHYNRDGYWIE